MKKRKKLAFWGFRNILKSWIVDIAQNWSSQEFDISQSDAYNVHRHKREYEAGALLFFLENNWLIFYRSSLIIS